MFRALLSKEWRQLRMLRWVGFGLGVLLPPFLLAVAEAAKRGRLPFARLSDYSIEQLLFSGLPVLGLGLWGLLALLFTAQSFAGDRAAGTESFLLERPVPRARIWWSRLLASLASLVLLTCVHSLAWLAMARLLVGDWGTEPTAGPLLLAAGGAIVALAATVFVAGIAAASFVASPIQAVLLGVVLAVAPPGLSIFLAGLAPMSSFDRFPVGAVIPWLLFPAYLVASFVICCRGEPAGRGRLRRGLTVLGAGLAAVPILFLVVVPWVLRAQASDFSAPNMITARDQAQAVCVLNNYLGFSSGWIVSTAGRRLRFLGPPVEGAAWNENGSRLAVAHQAGPLGSLTGVSTIDFFDESGSPVGRSLRLSEDEFLWLKDMRWSGGELVAALQSTRAGGSVLIIDPEEGVLRRVPVQSDPYSWQLAGPTAEGEIFVYLLVDREARRFELLRLDPDAGELAPEPLLQEQDVPTWGGKWVSPSGRYWMRTVDKSSPDGRHSIHGGFRIAELGAEGEWSLPDCIWARWMAGDRFACLEQGADGSRLTTAAPGEPADVIGSWPGSKVTVEMAPGGGRMLLQVWDPPKEPGNPGASKDRLLWLGGHRWGVGDRLHEVLVYEAATGELVDLTSRWAERGPTPERPAVWAGPETLAFVGSGTLALADLRGTDPPRFVFGRP